MPVRPDSIDRHASDWDRFRGLKRIIEMILSDTDPGENKEDKRRWILWHFLYIIWKESAGATTREQEGNGPARGVMQLEPATLWEIIDKYVLGTPTPGLVANLAAAAGVSEEEMREALDDFRENNSEEYVDDEGQTRTRGQNSWPEGEAPRTKLEQWLESNDAFGIKLMRYHFKMHGTHRFPPRDQDFSRQCNTEDMKLEHAEGWAEWWKRHFDSDEQREDQIVDFIEWARRLDGIVRRCEENDEDGGNKKASEDNKEKDSEDDIKKIGKEIKDVKKEIEKLSEVTKKLQVTIDNQSGIYPPISLKSYLSLLWGLALEIESNEIQNKAGTALRENIFKIFSSYKNKDGEEIDVVSLKHHNFASELALLSAKTIHNIAHLRHVHESFLKESEQKLEKTKKKYQDRSSLTSLSSEGLMSKIFSFIGGGALIPAYNSLQNLTKSEPTKIEQLEKLLELRQKYVDEPKPLTNTTTVSTKVVDNSVENVTTTESIKVESSKEIIENTTPPIQDIITSGLNAQIENVLEISTPQFDVLLFIGIGIGSMIAVNIAYKIRAWKSFEGERKTQNRCIENYMQDNFKPKIEKILEESSCDFKGISQKHYCTDDDKKDDYWNQLLKKEGFNDDTEIPDYIKNNIVPAEIFEYVWKKNTKKEKQDDCVLASQKKE